MSLVDYASSSDDDDREPIEEERKEEVPQLLQRDSLPPPPLPPHPRNQTKSESSMDQHPGEKFQSSLPSVGKLPDASLLLNSSAVSSNLMNASDHSSRVAAVLAENVLRKRDSNGMASSSVRSKVPRGNRPHSRNVPDTSGGMLLPPQISGRKNVVTEDLSRLFVKRHDERSSL